MDYRATLFSLVERVLAGEMGPEQFEDEFYSRYFDETPEDALTDSEHEFIGAVCERLDFTGRAPDAESRTYGWGDYTEFVDWLRQAYTAYQSGAPDSGDHDRAI